VLYRRGRSDAIDPDDLINQSIKQKLRVQRPAVFRFDLANSLIQKRGLTFPFDRIEVTVHSYQNVPASDDVLRVKVATEVDGCTLITEIAYPDKRHPAVVCERFGGECESIQQHSMLANE
jgi:hypothetical protein